MRRSTGSTGPRPSSSPSTIPPRSTPGATASSSPGTGRELGAHRGPVQSRSTGTPCRSWGSWGQTSTISRNDGTGSFGEAVTLGESPVDPDVLWVGMDDGNLQLSRDGGIYVDRGEWERPRIRTGHLRQPDHPVCHRSRVSLTPLSTPTGMATSPPISSERTTSASPGRPSWLGFLRVP